MFVRRTCEATSFGKQNCHLFIKGTPVALEKAFKYDDIQPRPDPSTIIRIKELGKNKYNNQFNFIYLISLTDSGFSVLARHPITQYNDL